MKTQPIMIGPTTKSAISDYGMESSCVDSIPELMSANSKSKSLESTPTNYGVEFYVGYSKLELFFANSKLEFVVKLKIPTTSLKKCLSMELKLFGWFLPKSFKSKILFDSIVLYTSSPMSTIKFFD